MRRGRGVEDQGLRLGHFDSQRLERSRGTSRDGGQGTVGSGAREEALLREGRAHRTGTAGGPEGTRAEDRTLGLTRSGWGRERSLIKTCFRDRS